MPSPFDPAPAMPGWNDDYTTDPSSAIRSFFDKRVVNMYIAAINERRAADGGVAITPAVTDDEIADTIGAWRSVSGAVFDMLGSTSGWVKAYEAGGGASTYYTSAFVIGVDSAFDTSVWSLQQRRYPREIATPTSTSSTNGDSVANGQKARLVGASSTYGSNTGQIFLRSAGAWVLDAGPLPDVVAHDLYADTGVPNNAYTPLSGDYFCAEYLNELRDAINQLVMFTYTTSHWTAGFWSDSFFHNYDGGDYGPSSNYTIAAANYDDNSTHAVDGDPANDPFIGFVIEVAGLSSNYRIRGWWGKPRITSLPMAGICNYNVYMSAYGTPQSSFNDFGSGVSMGKNNPVGSVTGTTLSTVTGSTEWGYRTAPTPYTSGGWSFANLIALVRYDVSGGFAYTKFT